MERFGDDWDAVADHVSTKMKEQCILHFLRLPIEEPYLEDQLALVAKQSSTPISSEDSNNNNTITKELAPFAESDNPVMTMIAFLASSISPTVAGVAAQTALGS